MSIAQKYLNDYNLPKDKGISKIMEGGENEQFEQVLSFFLPPSFFPSVVEIRLKLH